MFGFGEGTSRVVSSTVGFFSSMAINMKFFGNFQEITTEYLGEDAGCFNRVFAELLTACISIGSFELAYQVTRLCMSVVNLGAEAFSAKEEENNGSDVGFEISVFPPSLSLNKKSYKSCHLCDITPLIYAVLVAAILAITKQKFIQEVVDDLVNSLVDDDSVDKDLVIELVEALFYSLVVLPPYMLLKIINCSVCTCCYCSGEKINNNKDSANNNDDENENENIMVEYDIPNYSSLNGSR